MKKYTTYYVIGLVLIGAGTYLYVSKKNKKNEVVVNLNPPMEVVDDVFKTTETTVFTVLDKLKEIINAIKLKGDTTQPIKS